MSNMEVNYHDINVTHAINYYTSMPKHSRYCYTDLATKNDCFSLRIYSLSAINLQLNHF